MIIEIKEGTPEERGKLINIIKKSTPLLYLFKLTSDSDDPHVLYVERRKGTKV